MTSSNQGQVSVTFSITFDYLNFISEEELNDPSKPYLDMVRYAQTIEGALNISAAGQPDVQFRDIIAPWIQNLCFRGVVKLVQDQPLSVNYFSRSGTAEFSSQDSVIFLKSDHNAETQYPKSELLHKLTSCGSRFVAFAEHVKKDDADYMANLNYVKGFEAQAHTALESVI